MRRFGTLLSQDLVLAWRNGHIAVVIAIAALMIALVSLLPEQIQTGPGEYLYDDISGAPVRSALTGLGANLEGLPQSRAEYEEQLASHPNAIGVVVAGSVEQPQVTITQQTDVPQQSVNLLKATIDSVLRSLQGSTVETVLTERLRPQANVIPLNLVGLPVFLAFEVGILGFLLVAVFVFQEKQEGTIRSYRVTPAGLWPYLASKASVFTLLGIAYGVLVVAVSLGFDVNWPAVLGLVVWASLFMTTLGLGFAVWFNNLSHWFFPGLAVLVINMLPFFSYIYPIWSPVWMQFIPSYGLIFSLREALFPTGDSALITRTLLIGVGWLVAATTFAAVSVRARLLKGD